MATFSENQVTQCYVVNSVVDAATLVKTDTKPGAATVKGIKNDPGIYVNFKNALGDVNRTDIVDVRNILWTKASSAKKLRRPLKAVQIVINTDVWPDATAALTADNVLVGQDFLMRVTIDNYIGMSDEDKYFKYGVVHASLGMTKAKFYATLALSFAKNMAREAGKLFTVYLAKTAGTLTGATVVTAKDKLDDLVAAAGVAVIIEEVQQDWVLGVYREANVRYSVASDIVKISETNESNWGTVKDLTPVNFVDDGHQMADWEYFFHGSRGDQYRNVGWPYVINTKYMVDPDGVYDVIDIHYFYAEGGEGPQKSEKDLNILCPATKSIDGTSGAVTYTHTVANAVINALNAVINTAGSAVVINTIAD